jgi:hypothetical protein
MTRWPFVDALQILFQNLDSSIEQRTYREEPFLLSVDEVLGRPSRKEPEEPISDRIPPIPHVIGESGFLFSCFFGHAALLLSIIVTRNAHPRVLKHSAGLTSSTDSEWIPLWIGQQENQPNQ